MRRPVPVKQFFLWLKLCDLLGADQREAGCSPAPKAPFPSSQLSLRNGRNLSRARGLSCEPLTMAGAGLVPANHSPRMEPRPDREICMTRHRQSAYLRYCNNTRLTTAALATNLLFPKTRRIVFLNNQPATLPEAKPNCPSHHSCQIPYVVSECLVRPPT